MLIAQPITAVLSISLPLDNWQINQCTGTKAKSFESSSSRAVKATVDQ